MLGIVEKLQEIVGLSGVLTGTAMHQQEPAWDTNQPCNAKAIVKPESTAQVVKIMQLCHGLGQSVVPYGGLTNLVKGCVTTPNDIALSFAKMDKIEAVDTIGTTLTAQAGVTMQQAQESAAAHDLLFPVDIGSRGSCMLGGNVSSNAGGTKVIRHGMMRESVLGMEVVLADGTVLDSMNHFLKNNSGFDLKQLFIGTEGVLGLITKVVVRLSPMSASHNVAMLACHDYESVVTVLNKLQQSLGGNLCGFEVMWDNFVHQVVKPIGQLRSPVAPEYSFYAIVEAMGSWPESDDEVFQSALFALLEDGLLADCAVAKSEHERTAIWAIRHEVEWVVRDAFVFDVSLPIATASEYVDTITSLIVADIDDARIAAFGHLGDNNIHISVLTDDRSLENSQIVQRHIYESLRPYRGAISAEHGIGLEKRDWLSISRTEAEIALMKTLKQSLDPTNILNPGKVISLEP